MSIQTFELENQRECAMIILNDIYKQDTIVLFCKSGKLTMYQKLQIFTSVQYSLLYVLKCHL